MKSIMTFPLLKTKLLRNYWVRNREKHVPCHNIAAAASGSTTVFCLPAAGKWSAVHWFEVNQVKWAAKRQQVHSRCRVIVTLRVKARIRPSRLVNNTISSQFCCLFSPNRRIEDFHEKCLKSFLSAPPVGLPLFQEFGRITTNLHLAQEATLLPSHCLKSWSRPSPASFFPSLISSSFPPFVREKGKMLSFQKNDDSFIFFLTKILKRKVRTLRESSPQSTDFVDYRPVIDRNPNRNIGKLLDRTTMPNCTLRQMKKWRCFSIGGKTFTAAMMRRLGDFLVNTTQCAGCGRNPSISIVCSPLMKSLFRLMVAQMWTVDYAPDIIWMHRLNYFPFFHLPSHLSLLAGPERKLLRHGRQFDRSAPAFFSEPALVKAFSFVAEHLSTNNHFQQWWWLFPLLRQLAL